MGQIRSENEESKLKKSVIANIRQRDAKGRLLSGSVSFDEIKEAYTEKKTEKQKLLEMENTNYVDKEIEEIEVELEEIINDDENNQEQLFDNNQSNAENDLFNELRKHKQEQIKNEYNTGENSYLSEFTNEFVNQTTTAKIIAGSDITGVVSMADMILSRGLALLIVQLFKKECSFKDLELNETESRDIAKWFSDWFESEGINLLSPFQRLMFGIVGIYGGKVGAIVTTAQPVSGAKINNFNDGLKSRSKPIVK